MNFEQRLENTRERIYLPELFSEVVKLKSKDAKIAMLHTYSTKNVEHFNLIRDFIQSTFHPAVVLDLPESAPPFKSEYNDYNLAPTTLTKAFKRIPYFVSGHEMYIVNRLKREQIYIQTLESMYKPDADLFIMVKDKRIDQKVYKGLTEALLREAFPGFLPEIVKTPKPSAEA